MTKPVEFFFDFISPYGWFAAERIGGIARTHARAVAWRPLLLGVTVKQAMGLPPLLETPLKGPYIATTSSDARSSTACGGGRRRQSPSPLSPLAAR
jgi:2-hydroxychromene-2-carboxylate isomerase